MGFDGQILRVSFTICCGLSYLLYGYDQGFMSGVLLSSDWLSTVGNPSTFMQGVITSVYELGCFLGCVSSFVGSERYGRKRPIILGTILVIAGAVIQAAAYSRVQFMVGRVLAGVGTGLNTSIIPIWQAEILPARTREMFGSFQYMLVPTGAAISYWMNYALSYAKGQLVWRFPVAAQIIFAILLITMVPFMPESPRWLMIQNRPGESIVILQRMHGVEDPNDFEVQTEVTIIHQAIELESISDATGWLDLFKMNDTQNLRRLMLGWWLMAMVMLSGVCSIGYYIAYLFHTSVGLSENLSLLLSGFNGLWYLVSSLIPPLIMGRIGKRWCLLIGAGGMGCCFLVMTLGIWSGDKGASIMTVIAFFLYYTFFAIGFLSVPWLYCAEIMPLHLRSKGNAVTTSSNWLWNFGTVMMTPSMMGSLGWKGYMIFCILNFAFLPVIYMLYPETSGRRLEEIDAIFYKTSPIVAGTKWAKRGQFEANELEVALGVEGLKASSGFDSQAQQIE